MSVDMQFLMQKTEPLHQQARLGEPRSAAEPRFGAIMADLLEQSEQENNAALPVGQEIAVTAEQRRKLRAERHDKAPELKPVTPAPQHELSEDAPSELLGAIPVELTPVNTQPGQTKQDDILTILPIDEDLLNLIAVSEQYAVNLGVQDPLTTANASLTASDAALLTSLDSEQTANSEDGKSQLSVLNSGVAASQAADKLAALAAQFVQGSAQESAQGSAQQAALQHSQHMLNTAQDSAAMDALQLVTASLVQQAELHAAEQQAESTAHNAASMTAGVNNLLLEQGAGLSDHTQSHLLSAAQNAAQRESAAEQSALPAGALGENAAVLATQAVASEESTLPAVAADAVPVDTLHASISEVTNGLSPVAEVKSSAMQQASSQLQSQQLANAELAAESALALQQMQQTQPQLATVIVAPAMTQAAQLSFAEFQKAANAAQSQQQKQQQKAELVSGMPSAASIDTLTAMAMTQEHLQQTVMPPVHEGLPASAVADKLLATIQSPASANLSQIQSSSATSSQATAQLATKAAESALAPVFIQEPQAAQQLKERVMYQVGQKIQSAEVRLAPEELGSVQIKLNMQQEQLSVQFVVQQVQAKEALEQQMPRLRELLQQQGVELMDSQVSQQQQQQQSRQERSSSTGRTGVTEQDGFHDADKAPSVQVRYSDRVVDFYA